MLARERADAYARRKNLALRDQMITAFNLYEMAMRAKRIANERGSIPLSVHCLKLFDAACRRKRSRGEYA